MKVFTRFFVLCISIALSLSGYGQPGSGWGTPVFEDGFDGTSVNTDIWRDLLWDEYKPEHTNVSDGSLVISSEYANDGSTYGGRLDTWGKRTFRYGYYETRCRMEYKTGKIWPAVWLGKNADNTELDIFEWYYEDLAPNQSHHFTDDGYIIICLPKTINPADWHTYGVLWTPNEITFYIDDEFHYSSPNHADATDEIYLLLTSSPNKHREHSAGDTYPDFYVDYIKVWQKDDYSSTYSEQPGPINIPGTIEAEDYITPYGIQNVDCSEGGLAVGYTDEGDWMDYSVDVETAGEYEVVYRMATASTGRIELYIDDLLKGGLNIPYTGGWQNWRDFSNTVELPAGSHRLRIKCTSDGQRATWNLNNMTFTLKNAIIDSSGTDTISSDTTGGNNELTSIKTQESSRIEVYPNPAQNILNITGLESGKNHIIIYDLRGTQVINVKDIYPFEVDISNLDSGIYIIRIINQIQNLNKVIKFHKI